MAQVIDNLWISGDDGPKDSQWMSAHKIRLVVDCRDVSNVIVCVEQGDVLPAVVRVGMRDDDRVITNGYSISKRIARLEKGSIAIQCALERGDAVLVHCMSGINRSAFVIAWYLMTRATPPSSYQAALSTLAQANKPRDLPVLINGAFCYFLIMHAEKKDDDDIHSKFANALGMMPNRPALGCPNK